MLQKRFTTICMTFHSRNMQWCPSISVLCHNIRTILYKNLTAANEATPYRLMQGRNAVIICGIDVRTTLNKHLATICNAACCGSM